MHCEICKQYNNLDQHHLKTRKSGGSDHANNIVNVCRRCHVGCHQLGHTKMSNLYPNFSKVLKSKGWEFCLFKDRWVNYSQEITQESKKANRF